MSIVVNRRLCCGCEECVAVCPVGAIAMPGGRAQIDGEQCLCCAACVRECPQMAITIAANTNDKNE